MKNEVRSIYDKETNEPKFLVGLQWGVLLSLPLWAIFLIVLWYIIKA